MLSAGNPSSRISSSAMSTIESVRLEPVYPEGWHYSVRLRPVDVTEAQSADVLSRTTRAHCEAAFSHGTPAEVAAEVQAYVDAGCTFVSICDLLPLCLEPDDAQTAIACSLEVCGLIKAAHRAPRPAIPE